MRPIVEFCVNNMHFGTDRVMRLLEEDPALDVLEYNCLGHCETCAAGPYALVNSEPVEAGGLEELHERILARIAELEEEWNFPLDL